MARLWFGVAILIVAFTIFSIVDVALCDRRRVRALPKAVWIVVIVVLPVVGGILWFTVGRGRPNPSVRRTTAPDDDPDFLDRIGKRYEERRNGDRPLKPKDHHDDDDTDGSGT